MRYVSSFERIALRKGMEKGMEKGEAKLLNLLIRQRFGELPEWAEARLKQAAPEQVETWALRVLSAERLEEVFEMDLGH